MPIGSNPTEILLETAARWKVQASQKNRPVPFARKSPKLMENQAMAAATDFQKTAQKVFYSNVYASG